MTAPLYFSPDFIQGLMRKHRPARQICVQAVRPLEVDSSASILAALTAGQTGMPIGHFGLAVTYEEDGVTQTQNMVMKIKPHGREVAQMLTSLAQACGGDLAQVYPSYQSLTGFQHTHVRELEVYAHYPSGLTPTVFGLHIDSATDTYIILMEYLQEVELLNTVMAPEAWADKHIKAALSQIAGWHASHLRPDHPLAAIPRDDTPTRDYMLRLQPLWEALLENAAGKFPALYTPARTDLLRQALRLLPEQGEELEQMPHTLVHNDLNPRNTCFKQTADGLQFCVYDWELATFHVPQYDVVEFLCFVLDQDRYALRYPYLEHYRQELHALTGQFPDPEPFRRGFDLAAVHFGLHRLGMYLMAHALSPYPYLPRVVNSFFDTLESGTGYSLRSFSKLEIKLLSAKSR